MLCVYVMVWKNHPSNGSWKGRDIHPWMMADYSIWDQTECVKALLEWIQVSLRRVIFQTMEQSSYRIVICPCYRKYFSNLCRKIERILVLLVRETNEDTCQRERDWRGFRSRKWVSCLPDMHSNWFWFTILLLTSKQTSLQPNNR